MARVAILNADIVSASSAPSDVLTRTCLTLNFDRLPQSRPGLQHSNVFALAGTSFIGCSARPSPLIERQEDLGRSSGGGGNLGVFAGRTRGCGSTIFIDVDHESYKPLGRRRKRTAPPACPDGLPPTFPPPSPYVPTASNPPSSPAASLEQADA